VTTVVVVVVVVVGCELWVAVVLLLVCTDWLAELTLEGVPVANDCDEEPEEDDVDLEAVDEGPEAVEPEAGADAGVMVAVVDGRLLIDAADDEVLPLAPPVWPGRLWSCRLTVFMCCWVAGAVVIAAAAPTVPV
jgi:hypothetical protein